MKPKRVFRNHTSAIRAEPLLEQIRKAAGRPQPVIADKTARRPQPKHQPIANHAKGKPNAGF